MVHTLQILAVNNGLTYTSVRTLGQLATQLKKSASEMADIVEKQLHKGVYKVDEVLTTLHIDLNTFSSTSLSANTLHSMCPMWG